MSLALAHKIALDPTPAQRQYFARACGVTRFAWNWGLARWNEIYEQGGKPSHLALKKEFLNTIKKDPQYSWISEVTHWGPQQAFADLGTAFRNYFRNLKNGTLRRRRRSKPRKDGKPNGYPRFKRKGIRDSFYIANIDVKLDSRRVRIPKLGWVKMREELRFTGKILGARVSREADRWFIAIQVEMNEPPYTSQAENVLGIDLGLTAAATLSTGEQLESPRPLRQGLKKLRRASRRLARKAQKQCPACGHLYRDLEWRQSSDTCPGCGTERPGTPLPAQQQSNNWHKASRRLGRIHARIRHIRDDFLHKTTTGIVRNNGAIVLEDLSVAGMLGSSRLARDISDIGMYEFRRQVEYKGGFAGADVITAERSFASTQTCSRCGYRKQGDERMQLKDRVFKCPECGGVMNRDLNAALNLARYGQTTLKTRGCNACGDDSAGRGA